jgi:two-component system KDP operon response regulator KdpE
MKILIIEDDVNIADFIKFAFMTSSQKSELIFSYNGNKGIELFTSEHPELVIVDLMLPDIDGFEVIKQIRSTSKIPIIVITAVEEESSLVKAFGLGADEYIVKPFGQMEIIARVTALLRRIEYVSEGSSNLKVGQWDYNTIDKSLSREGSTIYLTSTENIILQLLASRKGHIVTFDDIARKIWGVTYPGSSDNIRVFISRLRNKLEKSVGHPQIIFTKIGIGYYIEK